MTQVRKKPTCDVDQCLWEANHTGPHGLCCDACGGLGIVAVRDNWARCVFCHGRGWTNVKGSGSGSKGEEVDAD